MLKLIDLNNIYLKNYLSQNFRLKRLISEITAISMFSSTYYQFILVYLKSLSKIESNSSYYLTVKMRNYFNKKLIYLFNIFPFMCDYYF